MRYRQPKEPTHCPHQSTQSESLAPPNHPRCHNVSPVVIALTLEIPALMHHDIEPYFRAHYGRLVRALTLISGSEEAAADAVQEAFVKAHLRWRTVSQYDDPVGWVRRVAINRLRDVHRSESRKVRAIERLARRDDTVVDAPEASEPSNTERVALALADLPRQQRAAVALYYLDGLSVAETAAALELSEGAVKFHLHQARERLRTLLGDLDSRGEHDSGRHDRGPQDGGR